MNFTSGFAPFAYIWRPPGGERLRFPGAGFRLSRIGVSPLPSPYPRPDRISIDPNPSP